MVLEIPEKWKNKFPKNDYSRNGSVDILVGADETKLFPIEKDRFNHKGAQLIL